MGLVVVILFAGLFVRVNERSLGWISREKVNQVRSMMENHGFGFNWGMSSGMKLLLLAFSAYIFSVNSMKRNRPFLSLTSK